MSTYLPGLNGIRAIAAVTVILAHTTLALGTFGLKDNIFGYLRNGELRNLDFAGFGVSIFFVLSGFLITFLLLKEKSYTGISIKKFYWRRILRIWPLYYFYFVLVLICLYIFSVQYSLAHIPFYIFLSANLAFALNQTIPYLIHYWSLGVEEQFYIFWPFLCRIKNSFLFKVIIFIISFLIGLKIILHVWFPGSFLENLIHINRFHCMLIGGAAAILFLNNNSLFFTISTAKFTQFLAWFVYFLAMTNQFHIVSFLDNEIISVFTVFIIMGQITKTSFISLEKSWLNFVGKISFGLYVYHPLLIYLLSKFVVFKEDLVVNYLFIYSLIISLTISISWISHTYLESYFLGIKEARYSNR